MTSRGPGRASRTREMDEKEQLRRQIRLLQGLIDDYKNLHGNAPAPGTTAAPRWQPPAYHGDRAFGTRYPRPSRRDFTHQGPSWRKKYSLVNWPPGSSDPPADREVQTPLGAGARPDPEPQQDVLERQVQLGSDHNMVIKIKPPSKAGCAGALVPLQGSVGDEDAPWGAPQPREGEGEPPGGQLQPYRPARGRGGRSVEDPLLVCQKEPGRPWAVRSVGSVSGSAPGPRRTVSESAVAVKAHAPAPGLGRTGAPHSAASCAAQLLGHGRVRAGHPAQPVPSGSAVGPARPASGARQAREASLLVPCRTSKFRKNNYKWVAASAKSPRAARRALSPRAAVENPGKAACGTAATETAQLRADQTKARRPAAASKPGPSPSKYKWKASSPSSSSSSSSSFRWQAEAGGRDHASLLAPAPSRSPPGARPAGAPGETSLSAYKVKSRTKIIRRRSGTSLPGDKKSSPSAVGTKTPVSLRRRQAVRGRSTPVLKKTPHRGLLQISRHRLCRLPTREACSLHSLRTPPTSKVIKTRYRIVKKTPAPPPSAPPCPLSPPSWRARRLSQSRALALNRVRPTAAGSARWGNKGYCCIGGVLYKVSANKLSKTSGRLGDAGSRPLLRPGRLDPPSSCSRSLASRAVQRSLAIIRQAKQKKEKKKEYCMYYNRFGRCNRGERCPYIHDPEKVAVCTRFVRGTCKKTDGTCPFSHQVSKEKMPVCSYFLRGVCSHSSCPYSHVYVSRKAEVCSDFLKGYCPLGAKCKKKHTLLCPDFARRGACPRGTQCQLLHRNKKRHGRRTAPPTPGPGDTTPRSRPSAGHGPRKPSASQHPPTQTSSSAATAAPASPPPTPRKSASAFPSTSSPKAATAAAASSSSSSSSSSSPSPSAPSSPPSSPSPSSSAQEEPSLQEAAAPVASSSGGLYKLPSFISLQSSPSPGGQTRARTPRSPHSKDSGRPLHIKPRL